MTSPARWEPHRVLVASVIVFLGGATIAWAWMVPFGGFPDELDHYLRSVGMAEGTLVGEPIDGFDPHDEPVDKQCCEPDNPTARHWVFSGVRIVQVAPGLDPDRVPCTTSVEDPRTGCGAAVGSGQTRMPTTMGTIEPVGYLAPALALRSVEDVTVGFRIARMANVLLGVTAVALVVAGSTRSRQLPVRVLGLCLAVTPMVVFVMASGSPNALEVAGALGVWVGTLEITSGRSRPPRLLWWGLVLSVVLLGSARSIGPLWLVAIAGVVIVLRGWRALGDVYREDRAWSRLVVGLAVLTAAATASWELVVQPSVSFDLGFAVDQLSPALADTQRIAGELIGSFGSIDLPLPGSVVLVWQGLVVALLALGLWHGSRRDRLAILLVGLLVMAAVVGLGAGVLRQNGFALQGRHLVPVALGLPLVAADALRGREADLRWVFGVVGVLCGALQLYAWAYAARSYGRTVDGLVVVEAFDGSWPVSPVLLPAALMLVGAIAVAAATILAPRLGAGDAAGV